MAEKDKLLGDAGSFSRISFSIWSKATFLIIYLLKGDTPVNNS